MLNISGGREKIKVSGYVIIQIVNMNINVNVNVNGTLKKNYGNCKNYMILHPYQPRVNDQYIISLKQRLYCLMD